MSVYVCVSRPIDSRPSKSKPCAPLPQLHLANEKHHYATLTATPLRAKMWEQESSERRGGRGDDFLKDTAPASCTGKITAGTSQNMHVFNNGCAPEDI